MVPEVSVKRSVPVPNINLVLGFPVFKLLRLSILVSLPAFSFACLVLIICLQCGFLKMDQQRLYIYTP